MISQLLDGRYRIVEVLDSHSLGRTYLAADTHLPGYPQCLVKQLQPPSPDPKTIQILQLMLKKKAEILERLGKHDRIPQLLAYFKENQEFYLVEEFIAGHSLAKEILPGQLLEEEYIVQLLREVLEILVFLHGHEVIHGNIKPANLIRRQSDEKLVLVGLGTFRDINFQIMNSQGSVTQTMGTPVTKLLEPGPHSPLYNNDLYAVGTIAIQGATGLTADELQKLRDANNGEVAWRSRSRVSPALTNILGRITGHYLNRDTYRSATAALTDLERFQAGFDIGKPLRSLVPVDRNSTQRNSTQRNSTDGNSADRNSTDRNSTDRNSMRSQPQPPSQPSSQSQSPSQPKKRSQSTSIKTPGPKHSSQKKLKQRVSPRKLAIGLIASAVALFGLALYLRLPQTWVGRYTLREGKMLLDRENLDAAIETCSRAIELLPKNSHAYSCRGIAYYKHNQYQKAADDLTQSLELNPDWARAYYYRGNTRFQLGDEPGAIEDYTQAIQHDPELAPAYMNRGNLRSILGDEQGAIEDFDRAVEIEPDLAPAYLNRCLSHSNLGDQKRAIEDCTQAIRIDPNYTFAYQNRGLARRRVNDTQGAIADFNIAIRLDPTDPEPYYNRGIARYELGDYPGAIADFNQVVQLNPDHSLVFYDRGLVLAKQGKREAAIADFQQAGKLCLDASRVSCYEDAQYQIQQLQQE